MKIMIIRHGDPDYALDSLTEKGFREAALLAERLRKVKIDDFYCSPLGRARATSVPTLEAVGKEAEILDWLREFEGTIISPYTKKNASPGISRRPFGATTRYATTRISGRRSIS